MPLYSHVTNKVIRQIEATIGLRTVSRMQSRAGYEASVAHRMSTKFPAFRRTRPTELMAGNNRVPTDYFYCCCCCCSRRYIVPCITDVTSIYIQDTAGCRKCLAKAAARLTKYIGRVRASDCTCGRFPTWLTGTRFDCRVLKNIPLMFALGN